tara:strand:- start:1710 stop:2213 length:504 start_codon:yes stop_codon:yes gene_type:complete
MKICINKYIYSFILFIVLLVTLYIDNYSNTYIKNQYEQYQNIQNNNWYNPKDESLSVIDSEDVDIKGLSSVSNDICSYPECDSFEDLYNSWENNAIKKDKYYTNQKQNTIPKILLNPNKFLSYNISSPDCCSYNSTYSTSNGCLCITPEQSRFLDSRGNNNYNIFKN